MPHTLKLFGDIGGNFLFFGDFFSVPITAASVSNSLSEIAGDTYPLAVQLMTRGGDYFDSEAIRHALEQEATRREVTIEVHGLAASGGAHIAVAEGTNLLMTRGALLLIHGGQNHTGGNAARHRSIAKALDHIATAVTREITNRSPGVDGDELFRMMSETTEEMWLSADEAIELGIAHGFIGDPDPEAIRALNEVPDLEASFDSPPEGAILALRRPRPTQTKEAQPMGSLPMKPTAGAPPAPPEPLPNEEEIHPPGTRAFLASLVPAMFRSAQEQPPAVAPVATVAPQAAPVAATPPDPAAVEAALQQGADSSGQYRAAAAMEGQVVSPAIAATDPRGIIAASASAAIMAGHRGDTEAQEQAERTITAMTAMLAEHTASVQAASQPLTAGNAVAPVAPGATGGAQPHHVAAGALLAKAGMNLTALKSAAASHPEYYEASLAAMEPEGGAN